jgi:hypothetical protein
MSARTIISVAASVIVGVALVATVSTDALAKKARVRVAAPPPVIVLNYVGPVADRIPKCMDSVIFYPAPPCY